MTKMEELLDTATYDGMKELLEDEFPAFLEMFFSENQEALDRIKSGLATNDADAIRTAAHNIKSSSAYLGAMTLSSLAQEMEKQAQTGSTDNISEMFTESQSILHTLKAKLA